MNDDRLVEIKEACALTGMSRTSLWRLERSGDFPKRVYITPQCPRWSYLAIQQWIKKKTGGTTLGTTSEGGATDSSDHAA